jgi:hypothetical protein
MWNVGQPEESYNDAVVQHLQVCNMPYQIVHGYVLFMRRLSIDLHRTKKRSAGLDYGRMRV